MAYSDGPVSSLSDAMVIHMYTLSMSQHGSGTIVPAEGEHQYMENKAAILAALPDNGWIFDGWDGDDVEDQDSPYTLVVMDSDKNIDAVFKEAVTLTIIATGGGSTTPPSGVITAYVKGTEVTIKAAPITDYEFTAWSGDLASTKDTEVITMDVNKVIVCTFRPVSEVASTIRKLFYATDSKKAYWNVDNQWVYFATIRHSLLEELSEDSHQQYHNDERGDARYYKKAEVDALIASGGESLGYWEPLTNGDSVSPELLWYNGDIIMGEVR